MPELTEANQERWFAQMKPPSMTTCELHWHLPLPSVISRWPCVSAGRSIDFGRRTAISRRDVAGSSLHSSLTLANYQQRGAARLSGIGGDNIFQSQYDRAEWIWQESLAIFRALEDTTGVAYSFGNLGLVADAQGDYDRGTAWYESALALFRQLNNRDYVNYMLHNLGLIAYFQGHYQHATALFEEEHLPGYAPRVIRTASRWRLGISV